MPAKIGVITHSIWGHQNTMSDCVAAGIEKSGNTAVRFSFNETLSDEILTKMHAAPKPSHPIITPDDLTALDGFILCFPTRYGRAPAEVSTFFDATGKLWATGALVGKFAGIVTSASSQHGGHETTALTTIPFFAHHGIIYVPIGFVRKELSTETHVVGGSAYGASTVAGGNGAMQPTTEDKAVAEYQGENFATIVATFLKGKHAAAATVSGGVAASNAYSLGAPIGDGTTPATSTAVSESGTAAKESGTTAEKGEGYAVPAVAEETPATTAATDGAATTPAVTEKPAAVDATPAAPAAATPAPAATATPKPVAAAQKKKGGFFSMCCGGDGSDLKA